MNVESQTQATLPLTRITFFLSIFVMSWGLFVLTHVWVVVFYWVPVAAGILVIILIGEGIAIGAGKQIIGVSKHTTNRLSILLIVGALLSPGVGFLIGYVQVQMIIYGTGIDALVPWQETTLLSQSSDIAPDRYIRAEFYLVEDPNTAQTKLNEWIKKRQAIWKSEPLTDRNGQRWFCDLPDPPISIRIEDQYLSIRLDHNTAWRCML